MVPLMLLEAIRLHAVARLVEQAMVGLQYILSSIATTPSRSGDAEARDRSRPYGALPGAADLQSAACGLLWKLAFADEPVREVIVGRNGVALIMGAMQKHAGHPRPQLQRVRRAAPSAGLSGEAVRRLDHTEQRAERRCRRLRAAGAGSARAAATGAEAARAGTAHPHADRRSAAHAPRERRGQRLALWPARQLVESGADSGPARPAAPHRGQQRAGRSRLHVGRGAAQHGLDLDVASRGERRGRAPCRQGGRGDSGAQADGEDHGDARRHRARARVWLRHALQPRACQPRARCAEGSARRAASIVLHAMRSHPDQTGCVLNACALVKELAEFPAGLQQLEQAARASCWSRP